MALSNRQRVQGAQDALLDELVPFVERALRNAYRDDWVNRVVVRFSGTPIDGTGKPVWDMQLVVKTMAEFWSDAFSEKLRAEDRNNVFELRAWRNALAHDQAFSYDDTYRALDTMHRVASRLGLPCAALLMTQRDEVLRVKFAEQARTVAKKVTTVEGRVPEGFLPWRDVIMPHADVRSGQFQAAEFAADLAQVRKGEASAEYGEPKAFFGRTFVTAGLRDLLANALSRLARGEGDPVVELQTNFGGGKTHSMLALYHLFGEVPSAELPGLEEVRRLANVDAAPPRVRRAVLVGTDLGVTRRVQTDGTVTNTMWGELAYQLAGAEGYAIVREADENRTSPGAEALTALLKLASPCLILIDEWVALLREIHRRDDLPVGSFESNISFVQALTEATKRVPRSLVVASLPQSKAEVAGEGGQEALAALKETFKRVQSTWLPASPEESFEIVRRRLFESIKPDLYRHVDATTKAFVDHYAANKADFPAGSGEAEFLRRLRASYPIHPTLFDALFGAWSTLERFQRTRGVLRLMALVIHRLWQQGDKSLMILPATVPLDDARVQAELRNYLGETWEAVMNAEVDGVDSLPLRVEEEDKSGRLSQVAAPRRVTRSVFLCTAPRASTSHQGVDARSVFLASVQPGESVGPFNDALRHVASRAIYLYSDASQYWFSTRPSLNRRAADLAANTPAHEVEREILRRLAAHARSRESFAGVHVTDQGGEVPDDASVPAVRLVILPPGFAHTRGSRDSAAVTRAREVVTKRGAADRLGRNGVVALAPDRAKLDDLTERVRTFLAWQAIGRNALADDLTPSDTRQAEARLAEAEAAVSAQLPEAYAWLLVPFAPENTDGPAGVEFDEFRLTGQDGLVARAQKRLVADGKLVTNYGARSLQLALDRTLWNGREAVAVRQLQEYFARYLYLDRLASAEVLLAAVREGVAAAEPYFGFADGAEGGRYLNLRFGEMASVRADEHAVVVHPAAALRQREAERAERLAASAAGTVAVPAVTSTARVGDLAPRDEGISPPPPARPARPKPTHALVETTLDTTRFVKRATQVYEEIVQPLMDADARVTVQLVVRGDLASGFDEGLQRTLRENARMLGLDLSFDEN